MRSYSVDKPIIIKAHALKYFTNLASHQPLQNRTIPLTFRNANIYMHDTLQICTILFAFRRGVGLPLPLHRPTPFPQPLQKGNTPSPHTTTLASLVKGEVLSPDKLGRRPEGLPHLPHPFRFSDTSVNNPSIVGSASHCNRSSPLHKGAKGDTALPTFPKPHYPSKIANTLAF